MSSEVTYLAVLGTLGKGRSNQVPRSYDPFLVVGSGAGAGSHDLTLFSALGTGAGVGSHDLTLVLSPAVTGYWCWCW